MEIRVENLNYIYSPQTPWRHSALKDVTFIIPSLSVVGILGITGSGKTTLLKNLNGLLEPTSGKVFLDGTEIKSFQSRASKVVGLVFQNPERQLFEETAFKDITFPFRFGPKLSEEEVCYKAFLACQEVGLDLEQIKDKSCRFLSEASKRKLAIACILINDPKVLILDEPLAGLDPYSALELVNLISNMKRQRKRTLLMVSHDMAPFMSLLDMMMVMHRGRLRSFGPCSDVCKELSSDKRLFELLPPIVHLKHRLQKEGFAIPDDEFDASRMAKIVAEKFSSEGVSR
ncbi:MAG: ATP-binding cassette domain-containing protein [Desulfomonilaceae bacterium]